MPTDEKDTPVTVVEGLQDASIVIWIALTITAIIWGIATILHF